MPYDLLIMNIIPLQLVRTLLNLIHQRAEGEQGNSLLGMLRETHKEQC